MLYIYMYPFVEELNQKYKKKLHLFFLFVNEIHRKDIIRKVFDLRARLY